MSLRATVILPSFGPRVRGTIDSLDRQTLRSQEFEVLVSDDGSDTERRRRLEHLVLNRTNVRVIEPAGAGASVTALLCAAGGDFVVLLEDGATLAPDALARLTEHAETTSADIVLATTSRRGERLVLPQGVTSDPDRVLPADAKRATGLGRLYRRTFLDGAGLLDGERSGVELDLQAPDRGATIVAVLDRAAFTLPAGPSKEAARRWVADVDSVRWSHGRLEVRVRLTSGEASRPGQPALAVRGCVFRPADGLEWGTGTLRPEARTALGAQVTATFDPAGTAGADGLADGAWQPALLVTEGERTERVTLRTTGRVLTASHRGGRTYVAHGNGGVLGLDVGALSHPVVPRLAVGATVVESVGGSLLTARVPGLELEEGARLEGQLRLGGLPVAAWVESDEEGDVVLRAWVSGLAGSSPLATKFSPAAFAPTGLRLVIDAVGVMTTQPVKRKKKAAKKPASPGRPAPSAATGLREQVKRLPGATTVYRRLNGLVSARRG